MSLIPIKPPPGYRGGPEGYPMSDSNRYRTYKRSPRATWEPPPFRKIFLGGGGNIEVDEFSWWDVYKPYQEEFTDGAGI